MESRLAATWTGELIFTADEARQLGAKIPGDVDQPIALSVKLDLTELVQLARAAFRSKGGTAKRGPVTVRRGRAS